MSRRLGKGTDTLFESRVRVLAAGIVLVFAVFLVRLVQLQIIEAAALDVRSTRNSIRTVRLEAPRGDIVDRRGEVIATTRAAFGLEVLPSELRRPDVTLAVLARLLGDRAQEALRERVGDPQGRARNRTVRLEDDLEHRQLARIEAIRYALPGVLTEVRPRRDYVARGLAAHLLGTIGEIRAEQLGSRSFAGYRPGEVVGQSGIEELSEAHLRGRAGGRNVLVDVAGREVQVLEEIAPISGGTVVLSLDMNLQREAVAAFDDEEGRPRSGALVALDPRNGDVLALVSRPAYDPNAFAGGIDAERWAELRDDPGKPLQNRVLAGQYPPGSTYKPFVAAAALSEGAVKPDTEFFCPGHFRLGRRSYRCWRREGHGAITLRDALKESCDVYFYNVGLTLGVDRLGYYARGFNFGRVTGFPFPEEKAGLVPTRAWKRRRFGEPWVRGETVSAAIGQSFNLVTPIQLAMAYGAIANGGRIVEPRVVLRRLNRDGTVVHRVSPRVRGRVPVRFPHLELIRDALEAVVEEPRGTGGRARVPDVRVAGKTGTAQVVGLRHTRGLEDDEIPLQYRDHAWFVAFAPARAPSILVVVLIEHGGGGGKAAAPIAQRVLARYFTDRSGSRPRVAAAEAQARAPD